MPVVWQRERCSRPLVSDTVGTAAKEEKIRREISTVFSHEISLANKSQVRFIKGLYSAAQKFTDVVLAHRSLIQRKNGFLVPEIMSGKCSLPKHIHLDHVLTCAQSGSPDGKR